MMDLSDAEAINHLMFNIQWHYALNLCEESDEAKYIGDKTLWKMRQIIMFCAVLKAAGINLIRAAAVRRVRRKAERADNFLAGTFLKLFAVVKEGIYKIVSRSGQVLANSIQLADDYLKIAA